MKKEILGFILTLLLAGGVFGYTAVQDRDVETFEPSVHKVAYVVDGDTLEIENGVRLRLIGIDTPEREECGYEEAREFLKEMVDNKNIRTAKDVSDTDKYGRILRYVYLPSDTSEEDVLVNESILRAGHGRTLTIPPDNRHRDLFANAQDEARRSGLGIWGSCGNTF